MILQPTTGTGLCSCLTVRVHDAVVFYKHHGKWPDEIDSSKQFGLYKEGEINFIADAIMGEYKCPELPLIDFNHGWQYGWYNEVQLEQLSKLAIALCPTSRRVGDKSYEFMQRMGRRTAILYRGNDKVKEIPATPYKSVIEMAMDTGSTSFIVQTDEKEFYDTFSSVFPDTIRFEELGMISRNPDAFCLPQNDREQFAVNFIAALRAIGNADKLITITGNTGLWAMFFRGHTLNTWQFNGNKMEWRKL